MSAVLEELMQIREEDRNEVRSKHKFHCTREKRRKKWKTSSMKQV